jgi:hypothetical protein
MPALFSLVASGSGAMTTERWIALGTIPLGQRIWIGNAAYSAVSKAITFELRTNLTGQVAGTTAATKLLDAGACGSGKSLTRDLYKNGALHVTTVYGTATGEKWWLRLTSKSTTSSNYTYKISYALE